MTEQEITAIARAVAQALAGVEAKPAPAKAKAKKVVAAPERGATWTSATSVVRGNFRFDFTYLGVVRATTNPSDKYLVSITRLSDGATIEARAKLPVGQALSERYAKVGALDALVGFRMKKFAAA